MYGSITYSRSFFFSVIRILIEIIFRWKDQNNQYFYKITKLFHSLLIDWNGEIIHKMIHVFKRKVYHNTEKSLNNKNHILFVHSFTRFSLDYICAPFGGSQGTKVTNVLSHWRALKRLFWTSLRTFESKGMHEFMPCCRFNTKTATRYFEIK